MRVFQFPCTVCGIATPRSAADSEHPQYAHVVFDGWDASSRAVADHVLKGFNIAVALRALRQHDGRVLLTVNMAGGEKRWRDAIHADAIFLGQIAQALELVHGRVDAALRGLRIAADIANTVACEISKVFLIARGALASQFHENGFRGRR